MSVPHPDLARWESASQAERESLLAHLRTCSTCRNAWALEDPGRIFALLNDAPMPRSVLDAVSRDVATAIVRGGRPGSAVFDGRFPKVAAWAAALILSLTSGWLLLAPSRPAPTIAVGPAVRESEPRAGVELLSSPGAARVVDLTVGDTQVVMIFDSELDL